MAEHPSKVSAGLRIGPRVLILGFWFCSLPTIARQTAGPEAECAIDGQVVDAIDGHPLADAQISIPFAGEAAPQGRSTITNMDGRFAVGNLSPGRFYIVASRPGYILRSSWQRTLSPGQHLDLLIRLDPAAVVAGRVIEQNGKGLGGVTVQPLRELYRDGRRQWEWQESTRTDIQGEYRIGDLPSGYYYISAIDYTGYGAKFVPEKARVPFYYPGVIDPANATKIDIRPGGEIRADITLPQVPSFSARGRVINGLTGKSARHAGVFVHDRLSDIRPYAGKVSVDASRGAFEIRGLVPGTYTLFAEEQTDPVHDLWISGWKLLEVGEADLEGVSLSISPGVMVTGRVRVEAGTQVNYTGLSVILDPRDDVLGGGEHGDPLERVNRDGTFIVRDLFQGTYDVRLDDPAGNFYLKSATQGGQELLVSGLRVSPPESPPPLELRICAGAGQIEGVVLDHDQPAMEAVVALIPDPQQPKRESLFTSAATDESSRFALRGITPGDYRLFAWSHIERVGYRRPDLLRPYEKAGVPVHITEGGKLRLNLQLIPN